MSPIRLIILAVLIYIGYLLIKGGSSKKKIKNNADLDSPKDGSDVLMEDPVCKKLVPKGQAVKLDYKGDTIYFCSEECCKKFSTDKGVEQ